MKDEKEFEGDNGSKLTVEYQYEYNKPEPEVGFKGGYTVEITGAYTSIVSQYIDNDGDVEIIFDIPLEKLDVEALTQEIYEQLSK